MAVIKTSLFMKILSINFPTNGLSFIPFLIANTEGVDHTGSVQVLLQGSGGPQSMSGGFLGPGEGDQYIFPKVTRAIDLDPLKPPTETDVFFTVSFVHGVNWRPAIVVYRGLPGSFVVPDPLDPNLLTELLVRPENIGSSIDTARVSPVSNAHAHFTLPATGNSTITWS